VVLVQRDTSTTLGGGEIAQRQRPAPPIGLRAPSSRKVGAPKKLVPEGGAGARALEQEAARSFNANVPPPVIPPPPPEAPSASASAGDKSPPPRKRKAKAPARRPAKRPRPRQSSNGDEDDGDVSEEELTQEEEDIEDALIETLERCAHSFGDEAVDGYVVWAKEKGFPWWPAQLITLVGMDPTTMKNIVAVWQPEYATTHVLAMFLGDRPVRDLFVLLKSESAISNFVSMAHTQ
jgi:hypothetical protein